MLFYLPMTCLNKAVMVILRNRGRGLEIYRKFIYSQWISTTLKKDIKSIIFLILYLKEVVFSILKSFDGMVVQMQGFENATFW